MTVRSFGHRKWGKGSKAERRIVTQHTPRSTTLYLFPDPKGTRETREGDREIGNHLEQMF
jgi:hypothetical protein